jgi:hypothetical protein
MNKNKTLFIVFILAFSALPTIFLHAQAAAGTTERNVFAKPLLEIVYETPRIVYATVTKISEDSVGKTRKVNVMLHRALKGNDVPRNFTAILHTIPYRTVFGIEFDLAFTALFFLHEEGGEWHINDPVYSCSYLAVKNDKIILKDVNNELGNPLVSFNDFEEGLKILAKKYNALKKHKKTIPEKLKEPANLTYTFLLDTTCIFKNQKKKGLRFN